MGTGTSFCASCGAMLSGDAAFCVSCGTRVGAPAGPVTVPPPGMAVAAPAAPATGVAHWIGMATRNPIVGGIVVLVLGMLVSQLLWPLLGLPARAIGSIIGQDTWCANLSAGTPEQFRCSIMVGLRRAAGSLIVGVVTLVFRRPIQAKIQQLTKKLAGSGAQSLVAPMFGTAMFTMVYSGIHGDTAQTTGFVGQRTFPAMVGLSTFLAARIGPMLTRAVPGFFNARDKIPTPIRLVLALAVPLLTAYVVNNQSRVSSTATKEQFVILLSLATTYLAVLPRSGQFSGMLRTAMPRPR